MYNLIKNKEQFRVLLKLPPVYDSLLSNSEEEYNDIYDKGIIFIKPDSLFKKIFDICLILLFLYDAFINSWLNSNNNGELCNKYKFEIVLNFIIEIFYIFDFIMGFFIAYYNNDEVLITKLELLIFNYLNTWCFFDFLMSIPFDAILYFISKNNIPEYSPSHNNENNIHYILTFIRKLKFIKLFSMDGNNYLISFLNEFEFFTFYGNIYLYFLIFMVLLHNICCVYIIIGKFTYPTWINILNLNYYDFNKIYICSLYYIISTVTTVGYGDISTYTCLERIFGIILLIAGIMGYSVTLTNVSSYINKMNSKTEEFENKMKILKDIKESNSLLSIELYEKIRRHIKYQNSGKSDARLILEDLPLPLRNNLLLTIYAPVIKNFIFFKNLHYTDFIIQILLKFKPIIASYNEILFKDGEFIEEVIFIKNGKVSLNVPINLYEIYDFNTKDETNELGDFKKNDSEKLNFKKILKKKVSLNYNKSLQSKDGKENEKYLQILVLRENEHFGIIHIFLNKRSTLCAKVKSKKAELFYLSKNDCLEISQTYTQIWKKINKKSIVNYFQIENLVKKTLQVYYLSKGIKVSGIFDNEILDETNEENSNNDENSSESFFSNNTIESKEEEEIDSQYSISSQFESEKSESSKNNKKKNKSSSINKIPKILSIKKNNNNYLSYIQQPSIKKKPKKKSIEKKKKDESDSDSSGMGSYQNQYYNNYFNKISLSQTSMIKTNLSEVPNSPKTINMNIFPEKYNNLNNLQNNNTNKISGGLTPFSPTEINDEIYPNEQFIFKEKSTNHLNSQNTETNSGYLLNNNIIDNSIFSKNNSKNNNYNLEINNVYSFYFQNSYNNINELTNFNYINDKKMQMKFEKYITNTLLLKKNSKEEETTIINTIKSKKSVSDFEYEDTNENKEKILNNRSNSKEKIIKTNIVRHSPKRNFDFKINKKIDFKNFSKEEEINEKYNNHHHKNVNNSNSKLNNFQNKKIKNRKLKSSSDITKVDQHKLLNIVNNNMQQNIYINGGGILNGNNFVEDFLQNELNRNKTHNLNPS